MDNSSPLSVNASQASPPENQLLTVLSFAMVAGMAVGLAFCGIWKYHPSLLAGGLQSVGLLLCPPVLLLAVLGTFDNTFAVVITIGTIVFANGFLYAGFSAGVYFFVTKLMHRRREN